MLTDLPLTSFRSLRRPSGLLNLVREHDKQAPHALEFSLYPFGFFVNVLVLPALGYSRVLPRLLARHLRPSFFSGVLPIFSRSVRQLQQRQYTRPRVCRLNFWLAKHHADEGADETRIQGGRRPVPLFDARIIQWRVAGQDPNTFGT